MQVDSHGNVYAVLEGAVGSSTPYRLVKVDASGQLVGQFPILTPGSFFDPWQGASLSDMVTGLAVDDAGHAFVIGLAGSPNVISPTQYAFQSTLQDVCPPGATCQSNVTSGDGFVMMIDTNTPNNFIVSYASYLGGQANDTPGAIALGPNGSLYILGYTESSNFPTTPGAWVTRHDPLTPYFVVRLDLAQPPAQQLRFGTFTTFLRTPPPGGFYALSNTIAVLPGGLPAIAVFELGLYVLVVSNDFSSVHSLIPLQNNSSIARLFTNGSGKLYVTDTTQNTGLATGGAFQPNLLGISDGIIRSISGIATNWPPVANSLTLSTQLDQPVSFTLSGSDADGNPLTYSVVNGPANGTLSSLSGTAPDLITYTPDPGFIGTDWFTFLVNDGQSNSTVEVVQISVTRANQPPIINFITADFMVMATSLAGANVSVSVEANDPDLDLLDYAWSGPGSGYVPGSALQNLLLPFGVNTVSVTVTDGFGGLATASVTVTVLDENTFTGPQTVGLFDDNQAHASISSYTPANPLGDHLITLTFSDVQSPGLSFFSSRADLPPAGMQAGSPPWYYDIGTTAVYSGNIEVCVATVGMSFADPLGIQLYQLQAGNWTPLFSALTSNTQLCGSTPSLGTFAIFYPEVPATAIETIAGNGIKLWSIDGQGGDPSDDWVDFGPATSVALATPFSAVFDPLGPFLYYSDLVGIHRLWLNSGDLEVVDPSLVQGIPHALALDAFGNLYWTDTHGIVTGNECRVRKTDFAANTVTTVAGGGPCGFSGDGGPALQASLWFEIYGGLAVDSFGNLFIADSYNNRIRRVDASTGIITTVAGNGTPHNPTAGMPATQSSIAFPRGIAFDSQGYLLVSVGCCVVRISLGTDFEINGGADSANEIVSIVAGDPLPASGIDPHYLPFGGDGGPATQALVGGGELVVASDGALILTETYGHRIRRVSPGADGIVNGADVEIITTIAGYGYEVTQTGIPIFNGDTYATMSSLAFPWSAVEDEQGRIIVIDTNNQRIRRFGLSPFIGTVPVNWPPVANSQSVTTAPDTPAPITLTGTDLNNDPLTFTIVDQPVNGALPGVAPNLLYTPNMGFQGNDSFTFKVNDGTSDSNLATVTITVQPIADVGVDILALPSNVAAGQDVSLFVTITNHGPSTATNITFSGLDNFSRWFTNLSAVPSQGTCTLPTVAGNPLVCPLGNMPNSALATIIINATTTAAPFAGTTNFMVSIPTPVAVIANEFDPFQSNNQADSPFNLVQPVGASTPVGTDVEVQPTDSNGISLPITVTFASVTQAGVTYADVVPNPGQPPTGFQLQGVVYDIRTTAVYTPPVTVCFLGTFAANDRLLHFVNGAWVVLPNQVLLPLSGPPFFTLCAQTNSLSPFADMKMGPAVIPTIFEIITVNDDPRPLPSAMIPPILEIITVNDDSQPLPSAMIPPITEIITVNDGDPRPLPAAIIPPILEIITVADSDPRPLPAVMIPPITEVITVTDSLTPPLPAVPIRADEIIGVTDDPRVLPPVPIRADEIIGMTDGPAVAPQDTTAPVVFPPSSITIGATEAGGARGNIPQSPDSQALAQFLAGATADDDIDPNPVQLSPQEVDCFTFRNFGTVDNTSLFSVGQSCVRFRFQDAAGNIGSAVADVTVNAPIGGEVNSAGVPITPTDASNVPMPIAITFAGVTQPGLITATPVVPPPIAPSGFLFRGVVYDITTTAFVAPPIEICFVGSGFSGSDLIWHNGTLVNPTVLSNSRVCGIVNSLSPFGVVTPLNQPPTANAGADQIVEATSAAGAQVTLTGSGSDADSDPLTFAWSGPCGAASGAVATFTCPLGASTMTLTVDDGLGGLASDTVLVTVRDTTPPVLALPANIIAAATSAAGAAVNYAATATDLVDGAIVPSCSPAPGATFPTGMTTVNCSATDNAGNSATGNFSVTVNLGTPRIAGSIAAKGRDASGNYYVDLRLTNTGDGHARNVRINVLAFRTLSGTGTVSYNTALSGALPLMVGSLDVGASNIVRLYLNLPSTVTRFSITEGGTLQNVAGTSFSFSTAQSVIP